MSKFIEGYTPRSGVLIHCEHSGGLPTAEVLLSESRVLGFALSNKIAGILDPSSLRDNDAPGIHHKVVDTERGVILENGIGGPRGGGPLAPSAKIPERTQSSFSSVIFRREHSGQVPYTPTKIIPCWCLDLPLGNHQRSAGCGCGSGIATQNYSAHWHSIPRRFSR